MQKQQIVPTILANWANFGKAAGRVASNADKVAINSPGLLDRLYREHWADICRFVQRRFGPGPPEPEEVAQIAFTRFATLKDPEDVRSAKAFLLQCAHNAVLDYHRRNSVRERAHDDIALAAQDEHMSEFSPERVLLGRERLALLETALRMMPALRRRVFLLVRAEGIRIPEVARRCAMAERSVYQHVFRAMRDIEAVFERAEQELDPYHER